MFDKAEQAQPAAARDQYSSSEIDRLARTLNSLSPRERDQLQRHLERLNQPMNQTDGDTASATQTPGFRPHGLTLHNVDEAFRYQPWNERQSDAGAIVVDALIAAAKAILRNVPDCPDRSSALRKVREARMDANSAITHEGRF